MMPAESTRSARPQASWSLDQWLRWQESLHSRSIDLGLDRVRDVAQALGVLADPPTTITVGGTNGKGSTSTLLAGILRAQGYSVGLFTSPHLRRYNERIAVDAQDASDAEICQVFHAIEAVRGLISLTYFEYGTLAALEQFRRRAVDIQILEVGLGGRLDAVNIVDADCSIVTNIGLDHLDWLGHDRDSIGREKAGIFRRGRPAIIADPEPPQGLLDAATAVGASPWLIGRDFDVRAVDAMWNFEVQGQAVWTLPPSGMGGAAQRRNTAAALAAVYALREQRPVRAAAIAQAVPAMHLQGRFQPIGNCVLDVAHNLEAAQELAANLRRTRSFGRTLMVIGMLDDKPVEAVAAALAPEVDQVWCVGLPPPRGLDAQTLSARLEAGARFRDGCSRHDSVRQGLAAALADARSEDRVLITGSFLTVAAALEQLDG